MTRQGKKARIHLPAVNGNFTGRLHGIAMEADTVSGGDRADLPYREDRTGLVIGIHGRNQDGAVGDGRFEPGQVQAAPRDSLPAG